MQTVNQEYSNFVTPPDFVNEKKPNVLLIDVPAQHIQSLGMYLMTCECYFNIYLYNHEMGVPEWFGDARNRADAIIVNTTQHIQHHKGHAGRAANCLVLWSKSVSKK